MKFKYLLILFFTPVNLMASAVFSQPCRAFGDDYLKFSIETDNLDIKTGSSFALKITAFEDQNCTIPYLQYNQYFTVDRIQSEQIDLKTEKVTYTALSEEVAEALRLIKYCDFTDWQAGSETNVTGKICDDYQQLSKNDLFYQILRLSPDSLQFGTTTDNLDGRDPKKRPIEFDSIKYLFN